MDHLVIDASKTKLSLNIKELIRYKDLFFILAYKDIKVRYAQTFVGLLWAVLQPLATLLIFVVIFGVAIKIDTSGVQYPLFAIVGMTSWTYFSFVMSQSGSSIIGAQEMVKKIYFPRLIIPLSKSLVGLIDFAIMIIFVFIMMLWYQHKPSVNLVFLPLFVLLTIVASLAIGIWLSALTIRYRDFQHVVPFMVQFGLYATPIAYPTSILPAKYLILYYLNPMAGVVEGFRWAILGTPFHFTYSCISFSVILILFITSLFYFRKVERVMADIV